MKTQTAGKSADISLLRIVATLGVVMLHTYSTIWLNADSFVLNKTQVIYLYTGSFLLNWTVPAFFMITGALLLNPEKEIRYKDCITKYCRRIVLALLIFGLVFSWIETIAVEKTVSWHMFTQSLLNIITENSWGHLWYLYALIGIYLTLPIWRGYIKNTSRKTQGYILVVIFVLTLCIPVVNDSFGISILPDMPMITVPVFLILAGRYFYEETPSWLRNKKVVLALFIAMLVVIALVSIFVFPNGYTYLKLTGPFAALSGILIFNLFKGVSVREEKMDLIWKIDRICFGVYLIHPIFINFAYKFLNVTPLKAGSLYWLATPAFGIVFIILSFALSWVMNLIKPLKKYVL